jgi:hypothetical protein
MPPFNRFMTSRQGKRPLIMRLQGSAKIKTAARRVRQCKKNASLSNRDRDLHGFVVSVLGKSCRLIITEALRTGGPPGPRSTQKHTKNDLYLRWQTTSWWSCHSPTRRFNVSGFSPTTAIGPGQLLVLRVSLVGFCIPLAQGNSRPHSQECSMMWATTFMGGVSPGQDLVH